jgi:hypothetical protein
VKIDALGGNTRAASRASVLSPYSTLSSTDKIR